MPVGHGCRFRLALFPLRRLRETPLADRAPCDCLCCALGEEADMTFIEQIAEKIVAIRYADLPEDAVHWAKAAILDTLGVTLAGASEDCARIVAETLGGAANSHGGPCLIF